MHLNCSNNTNLPFRVPAGPMVFYLGGIQTITVKPFLIPFCMVCFVRMIYNTGIVWNA